MNHIILFISQHERIFFVVSWLPVGFAHACLWRLIRHVYTKFGWLTEESFVSGIDDKNNPLYQQLMFIAGWYGVAVIFLLVPMAFIFGIIPFVIIPGKILSWIKK